MKPKLPANKQKTPTTVGSGDLLGGKYSIGTVNDGRTILRVWQHRDCKYLIMDANEILKLIRDLTWCLDTSKPMDALESRLAQSSSNSRRESWCDKNEAECRQPQNQPPSRQGTT